MNSAMQYVVESKGEDTEQQQPNSERKVIWGYV